MNPASSGQAARTNGEDEHSRVAFLQGLQALSNKIHATSKIDEIMLELSQDVCDLFNADRLTIYSVTEDKGAIISKVKTGLNSFRDLRLPIADQSVAGYVALQKTVLNLRDVYDPVELCALSPNLHFLSEVDKRTGYRTKQMLVAPIVDAATAELLGVVQLINNRNGVPFSKFEEDRIQELTRTLAIAFNVRRKPHIVARSKYDHLVADAVLSAAEFEIATRAARRKNADIEDVLTNEFEVKPEVIGQALSKFFGVPYEPYRENRLRPLELLRNLKREYLEETKWLPLEDAKDGLVILTTDPEQVKSSRVVSNVFPRNNISYRVTTVREFRQTLEQIFSPLADMASVGELLSGMGDMGDTDVSPEDISAAADNELVRLVNKIIVDAYQQGASDIHVEPQPGKDKTLVRFRRDGSLVPYIEVPASYRNAIVTRLKIMCDLDISERRKPQDGKIKFRRYGPLDIELRVATIPSAGGVEDVVMRILASGEPIPLDKLGVLPHNLQRLKEVIDKPYGIFFVCGPTGSGKTTTLHSILGHINTPDRKIWTAEDPVEITQKGLRQVQVNRKAGLDFATAMRAFLRADPDVIMVGEMRDRETVSIGLEASLTGHLVFATLHTNSAPESIVRLLDMGMDPFNFSDALLGVLAQRLAKRLCPKCRRRYNPPQDELAHLLQEYCQELGGTDEFSMDPAAGRDRVYQEWLKNYADEKGRLTLYRAVGCTECSDTGYRGRVGLHELMTGTENIKRLVQERARVSEMFAMAVSEGMRTLRMDGIEKVLAGHTDLKQVRAVCIK